MWTIKDQGPVVQSIISLTSLLEVKMWSVLVSTISNSQLFLQKKMWVAFAFAKTTHIFFSKNISAYAIFNDKSFNDTLTNNIVSFDQLGLVQPAHLWSDWDLHWISRIAELVEHQLCDREIVGSIPSRVLPKDFKNGTSSFAWCSALRETELGIRTGQRCVLYDVTVWNMILCVWGRIFQWSSTLKVSIVLVVTSRQHYDMTERLLKVT